MIAVSNGYIKLHRKLLDNPIMEKPELLQLFIYCLLRANHKPERLIFNGVEMVVNAGQFITGRDALSLSLGQNSRTLYDRLKVLEKLKIINIKSNNRFSLITIVNYEFYQKDERESNSKSNNKPTTNQQQTNTNKNDKNDKNDKKYKECVYLSEVEYKSLVETMTEKHTLDFIDQLNNYILKIGELEAKKRYKSHYATILSWYKKSLQEKSKEFNQSKVSNKGNFTQRSHEEDYFEGFIKEV
jgi:hypothetical protein